MTRIVATRRGSFRRVLVRLLVLLLVPVLVMSTSRAAEASTVYGDPLAFTVAVQDNTVSSHTGGSVNCAGNSFWKRIDSQVPSLEVKDFSCGTGFAIRSADVTDVTASGGGCNWSNGSDVGDVDGGQSYDVSLIPTLLTLPHASGDFQDCIITQVCVTAVVKWWETPFGSNTYTGCGALTVGAPPTLTAAGTSACAYATVTKPTVSDSVSRTADGYRWQRIVSGKITATSTSTGFAWYPYSIVSRPDNGSGGGGSAFIAAAENSTGVMLSVQTIGFSGLSVPASTSVDTAVNTVVSNTTQGSPNLTVIGAGYFLGSSPNQLSDWLKTAQGNAVKGRVGITDPGMCLFYWGTKISTDSPTLVGSGTPIGGIATPAPPDETPPVTTPPTPDPASDGACSGFSFTDPTSWAGAGICELVRAVSALVSAVGAVVDFIGSFFATLGSWLLSWFVPADGSAFTDATDAMQAEVDDSNYADWQASFEAGVAAPGGGGAPVAGRALPGGADLTNSTGCEGPGVSWDKFSELGMPTDFHPLAACTGTVATAAEWCRTIATAFIGIFGVVKILGMLLASLGWMKQTGILLNHDWSDRIS